jgi:hypothetical protein
MADSALFIGWGEIVRGRERNGPELFNEAIEYFGRLQQDGRIEGFEPWFMERHGGDLNGFFLLRGDRTKLDDVRRDADFERLLTRVSMVVDNVGVTTAYTGADLQRQLGIFQESAGELAG